jgi:hypothetical protein
MQGGMRSAIGAWTLDILHIIVPPKVNLLNGQRFSHNDIAAIISLSVICSSSDA